jgi:hypothetical protein
MADQLGLARLAPQRGWEALQAMSIQSPPPAPSEVGHPRTGGAF